MVYPLYASLSTIEGERSLAGWKAELIFGIPWQKLELMNCESWKLLLKTM